MFCPFLSKMEKQKNTKSKRILFAFPPLTLGERKNPIGFLQRHMKGMTLPTNMIVILLLAAIVLVAVIAFFLSGTDANMNVVTSTLALEKGCSYFRSAGCADTSKQFITSKIAGYTVDGKPGTVLDACKQKLGDSSNIATLCFDYCCGKLQTESGGTSSSSGVRPDRR